MVNTLRSLAEAEAVLNLNDDIALILLDPDVPNCSCKTAVDRILDHTSSSPTVVVLASDEEITDLLKTFEQGISYLPKSASIEVLQAAVVMALAGNVFLPVCKTAQNCQPCKVKSKNPSDEDMDVAAEEHECSSAAINAAASTDLCSLGLTVRQTEVLYEMLQGKPIKLIARALDMSDNTAKTHIGAILRALHVTSRTQAVIAANKIGLKVDMPELIPKPKRTRQA